MGEREGFGALESLEGDWGTSRSESRRETGVCEQTRSLLYRQKDSQTTESLERWSPSQGNGEAAASSLNHLPMQLNNFAVKPVVQAFPFLCDCPSLPIFWRLAGDGAGGQSLHCARLTERAEGGFDARSLVDEQCLSALCIYMLYDPDSDILGALHLQPSYTSHRVEGIYNNPSAEQGRGSQSEFVNAARSLICPGRTGPRCFALLNCETRHRTILRPVQIRSLKGTPARAPISIDALLPLSGRARPLRLNRLPVSVAHQNPVLNSRLVFFPTFRARIETRHHH